MPFSELQSGESPAPSPVSWHSMEGPRRPEDFETVSWTYGRQWDSTLNPPRHSFEERRDRDHWDRSVHFRDFPSSTPAAGVVQEADASLPKPWTPMENSVNNSWHPGSTAACLISGSSDHCCLERLNTEAAIAIGTSLKCLEAQGVTGNRKLRPSMKCHKIQDLV